MMRSCIANVIKDTAVKAIDKNEGVPYLPTYSFIPTLIYQSDMTGEQTRTAPTPRQLLRLVSYDARH